MTIMGVTGTRENLTNAQMAWVYRIFEEEAASRLPDRVTGIAHGACTGADEFTHGVALEQGMRVDVWPPVKTDYLATTCIVAHHLVTLHPAMPYLNRDREVVKQGVAGLLALPKQNEQPSRESWGGTWYTVDFAERMGRNVVICYPNGLVEKRIPLTDGRC